METNDFFTLTQELWFQEYVEAELSKNLVNTNTHNEIFEFDDVPF